MKEIEYYNSTQKVFIMFPGKPIQVNYSLHLRNKYLLGTFNYDKYYFPHYWMMIGEPWFFLGWLWSDSRVTLGWLWSVSNVIQRWHQDDPLGWSQGFIGNNQMDGRTFEVRIISYFVLKNSQNISRNFIKNLIHFQRALFF